MKILLIRHGETVDNVAGIYAGTLDSPLTNHGLIQADKLGQFLQRKEYRIRRIFSSDLQRAFLTAQSIEKHQVNESPITCLKCLREQDFGFYEGKKISSKSSTSKSLDDQIIDEKESSTRKVESRKSLDVRADLFIDDYLSVLLTDEPEDYTVAVVSHGIFLSRLWGALLKRFSYNNIYIQYDLAGKLIGRNLKYLCKWSNTGYLQIDVTKNIISDNNFKSKITPNFDIFPGNQTTGDGAQLLKFNPYNPSEIPRDFSQTRNNRQLLNLFLGVKAINSLDHLDGLHKLRGGTGNLRHDPYQKTIDKYFQKLR